MAQFVILLPDIPSIKRIQSEWLVNNNLNPIILNDKFLHNNHFGHHSEHKQSYFNKSIMSLYLTPSERYPTNF